MALRSLRPGRLRSRLARLLNALIINTALATAASRRARAFQQHAVGAGQLGLDKTARVGGGIDEITRRAAARTKSEAIERDQSGLQIAGHRGFP